jgi:alpha-glucosidase
LPWSGSRPPFGFSPSNADAEPWLPQPASWTDLTVETQQSQPSSMLNLYRAALRIRRSEPGLGDGPMAWLPSDDDVLAFRRGDHFVNVTNMSAVAVTLPPHAEILLTSADTVGGLLPPDATAWLVPAPETADHRGG